MENKARKKKSGDSYFLYVLTGRIWECAPLVSKPRNQNISNNLAKSNTHSQHAKTYKEQETRGKFEY